MTDFAAFARDHGLLLEHPVPDGRIHRVPTQTKPRKRNGAYRWLGEWGWAQCWDTMTQPAVWRSQGVREQGGRAFAPMPVARALLHDRQKALRAAARAGQIVNECQFMSHPYLARKGFPSQGGLVHADGRLVVPMRNLHEYSRIQSVQFIAEDGDKRFLPGGAAAEAVFIIGPPRAPETWVVEGLVTGYSVMAALKSLHRQARVMVCFSAGNLARVGAQLKGYVRVVADHDASDAGRQVAIKAGRRWVMPPEVGMDANDWAQSRGLRALSKLLLEVIDA